MKAVVITVSDRSAAGQRDDTSGAAAEKLLQDNGFTVGRALVADDREAITDALRVASRVGDVVLTTGGTGFGPRDCTPEATRAALDREAPGLAEHLRRSSVERVPTAVLSRGVAGTIGRVLVVNLPGSPGGVRDGIAAPAALAAARPLPTLRRRSLMLARLQTEPLDVAEVLAAVADRTCGGEALFIGVVRDHDSDKAVTRLTYEAHPSAPDELTRICSLAAQRLDVRQVAAVHRTGVLEVGDAAVIVAVSAPHRAEALEACRWLIDTLKHEVPIWKHQIFADGTDEWVGSC